MPQGVKLLRSNVIGRRPAANAAAAGELYLNMADHVLGFFDATGQPVDLGAQQTTHPIPEWVQADRHPKGMLVKRGDTVYRAKSDIPPGAAWSDLAWEDLWTPRVYQQTWNPQTRPTDNDGIHKTGDMLVNFLDHRIWAQKPDGTHASLQIIGQTWGMNLTVGPGGEWDPLNPQGAPDDIFSQPPPNWAPTNYKFDEPGSAVAWASNWLMQNLSIDIEAGTFTADGYSHMIPSWLSEVTIGGAGMGASTWNNINQNADEHIIIVENNNVLFQDLTISCGEGNFLRAQSGTVSFSGNVTINIPAAFTTIPFWIQSGANMIVNGNLTINAPNAGGAVLVVDGNLNVNGKLTINCPTNQYGLVVRGQQCMFNKANSFECRNGHILIGRSVACTFLTPGFMALPAATIHLEDVVDLADGYYVEQHSMVRTAWGVVDIPAGGNIPVAFPANVFTRAPYAVTLTPESTGNVAPLTTMVANIQPTGFIAACINAQTGQPAATRARWIAIGH